MNPASSKLINRIFSIAGEREFNSLALDIFRFQVENNPVYQAFISGLSIDPAQINSTEKIPFLPVEFFKTHPVISSDSTPELIFESSGTTGNATSKHQILDASVYKKSLLKGFELLFGDIREYCILALLPSYLERTNSSLVFMVNEWMKASGNRMNGFYLDDFRSLSEKIDLLESQKQKTILIGVSFALLDFADLFPKKLNHIVVMETGGMKGNRKEMVRSELHEILKNGFGLEQIHSEYGMTELLSQAYSKGMGEFVCPPWMRILISDIHDPFSFYDDGKSGAINIIDLANINSCSFISTQDVGKRNVNGTFEVLGRFDQSDIRGCNLLVS